MWGLCVENGGWSVVKFIWCRCVGDVVGRLDNVFVFGVEYFFVVFFGEGVFVCIWQDIQDCFGWMCQVCVEWCDDEWLIDQDWIFQYGVEKLVVCQIRIVEVQFCIGCVFFVDCFVYGQVCVGDYFYQLFV